MRDEQLTRQQRFTRCLTWEEMQKRRAQGLCFNCNERFTTGHRCQRPQLLLLEEDQGGDTGEVQEPEITLHTLTGWAGPKTMCIIAKMSPHEVVVLVNSGSTNNFISDRLANLLRLPVIPTKAFFVRVANGEKLKCQGRYDKVRVEL
ncbi:hypothetical protein Patl1_30306 [Pistacia atlantica]|uniref:Uncharacterized protein n=1 Tax=Pistacia atlantica TaxID=434234 RepID=A0ACC1ACP6_9ROSI|nr:hypothetical protein Patl1_30306 [Pistacia atlantica]